MQRIGVFVCHCGSNIAATVDVKKVVEVISQEPGVVHAEDYQYMCSENGQQLVLTVKDQTHAATAKVSVPKAYPHDPGQIGMPLNGTVVDVMVENGQEVKKGQTLVVTEAMKMETTIKASFDGKIDKVYAKAGSTMESQDLLIQMSPLS